jgi:hypothetical protein
MNKEQALNDPWLVAVWPGMGAVSISAGYYLMAKLGMHLLTEFPALEFFDLDHIDVKRGLIITGRLPRSRLFLWHDPMKKHDLIVFIGEAQPPSKSNAFCSKLIRHVRRLGVECVFTFAAMATQMRPEHPSRVFGGAIDRESLSEFKSHNVEMLDDGKISGLNGALLGIAAENGMRGGCLLGEMPHAFAQFPYPKASLAVLETFTSLAGITIDLTELQAQALHVEQELDKLLHRLESSVQKTAEASTEVIPEQPEPDEDHLSPEDQEKLEKLFSSAEKDRSRAYELKQVLDRLKVFPEYEDRFLDLFKKPD